jgi:Tol biopolymer transport system component
MRNTNTHAHGVYSPDGKRIAYSTCSLSGTSCDIWMMNADGSNPIN